MCMLWTINYVKKFYEYFNGWYKWKMPLPMKNNISIDSTARCAQHCMLGECYQSRIAYNQGVEHQTSNQRSEVQTLSKVGFCCDLLDSQLVASTGSKPRKQLQDSCANKHSMCEKWRVSFHRPQLRNENAQNLSISVHDSDHGIAHQLNLKDHNSVHYSTPQRPWQNT